MSYGSEGDYAARIGTLGNLAENAVMIGLVPSWYCSRM